MIRRFLLVVVFTLFTLFFSVAALLSVLTTSTPLVQGVPAKQLGKAESVQPLFKALGQLMQKRHQDNVLQITAEQLESLLGVMHRAYPLLSGQAVWYEEQLRIQLTFDLEGLWTEQQWSNRYVNAILTFENSDGVGLESASLGKVNLSGTTLSGVLAWGLNQWTQTQMGDALLHTIRQTSIADNSATFDLFPIEPVIVEYKKFKRHWQYQDMSPLTALATDYIRVIRTSGWVVEGQTKSLLDIMVPVFDLVSQTPLEQQSLHAQAAIIAMASIAGHMRVATVAGINKETVTLPNDVNATLLDRNDLARHYIISAALNVLSQSAMSLAIGEFKELMDRAKGGSGYSFVDLAADMAGNALAEALKHDHKRSFVIQRLSELNSESELMPSTSHLPEGLSVEAFRARFVEVDSPAYRQLVDSIATELSVMPLYRL